jgi:hypothetical protein
VVALAAVLGNQVPEEALDRMGWDYGGYRIIVFLVLFAALAHVGFVSLMTRTQIRRLTRDVSLTKAVLIFAKALLERDGRRAT